MPLDNAPGRDFVHLHLHSDYSLLQSTVQLEPLAAKLQDLEMKACAISDLGNMYGAISFYNKLRSVGIKPLIGYEAFVATGSRFDTNSVVPAGERPYYNLVLLATNLRGYFNLVDMASRAFTEGNFHRPRIDLELLGERNEGIVVLTGGRSGAVGHHLSNGNTAAAERYAVELKEIFGHDRLFLEIQDTSDGQGLVEKTAELGKKLEIPLVATNDVYYLEKDDALAREILVALGESRTIPSASGPAGGSRRYLRSAEEMWEIFGSEYPDALKNTIRIAEMCDLKIPQGREAMQLPSFPIPSAFGTQNEAEYFEFVTREGFKDRLAADWEPLMASGSLKHTIEEYETRLKTEMETIKRMGFPGYFLIVWDFIRYARENGIPVGPGRGSAAGSLVAYCLRITDVDPIQHDLLFERFLNPERVSMPDIDIDFCIRGRGNVIDHVTELYGRDSVCQIVTFGTMASRAAIKDVGRVLGMSFGEVERIAKLMPPPRRGRNISIKTALEEVPDLKKAMETDKAVRSVIELAQKVEGCARHTSVHAAGVVISPKPLNQLVPVAVSAKDELTSQYPMGDLEKVGMLKMDFLGLTTLTIIADCLAELKARTGIEIDWTKIPTDDPATMKLFGEGRTDAIFQFESSGMQDICRRMKPENLEDLSALNALYRPGPLDGGMVTDFVERRRGLKPVEYFLPELEEFLKPTYGVLVYQEQIMQIAQKLAGYSLGDADLMRRAMGKKKVEEMAEHRERFVSGAVERGVNKNTAKEIFELMAKFADYGFNRSHSLAYAVLAFRTGYLKAHFPSYFYAAVLSHEADDAAKVYKYSNELKQLGLTLLPPDINESGLTFTPLETSVRFGLGAIKGLGASSVNAMIEARQSGPFSSMLDLASRVEGGILNRRALESLIGAGAFDSLMPENETPASWRAKLAAQIDTAVQHGQRAANDRMRGQTGLFGTSEASTPPPLPDVRPWTEVELSNNEKASFGFYFASHPIDQYADQIAGTRLRPVIDHSNAKVDSKIKLVGVVSGFEVRFNKAGKRFASFRLEDRSGSVKVMVWAEALLAHRDILQNDSVIVVEAKVRTNENQDLTVELGSARPLASVVAETAPSVTISVPRPGGNFFEELYSTLASSPGSSEVILALDADGVEVRLRSGSPRVTMTDALRRKIEEKGCTVTWQQAGRAG